MTAPAFRVIRGGLDVAPGPLELASGTMPGGVVVRVYDLPARRLVLERCLSSTAECERLATADAAFVAALTETCWLVVYDGDTGARLEVPEW